MVSPKTCDRGVVEFTSRDKTIKMDLPFGENNDFSAVVAAVKEEIAKRMAALNG